MKKPSITLAVLMLVAGLVLFGKPMPAQADGPTTFTFPGGSLTTTNFNPWDGVNRLVYNAYFDFSAGPTTITVYGMDLTNIWYEGRWPWPVIPESQGAQARFGITANGFWSLHSIHSAIGNGGGSWDQQSATWNHDQGFRKYLIQNQWFGTTPGVTVGNHQYNVEAYIPRTGTGPSVNDPAQVIDREYNTFDMKITYTPTATPGQYQVQGWVRLHKATSTTEMATRPGSPTWGSPYTWVWNKAINNQTNADDAWVPYYDGSWVITGDYTSARPYLEIINWGVTQTKPHTFSWANMVVEGTPAPASEVCVDDGFAGSTPGVSLDGTACGMGSVTFGYNAFATIQDGVNAVSGSTVHVAPGTYDESVAVNKDNLTLLGDASSKPAITNGLKLGPDLTGLALRNFDVSGNAVAGQNSVVRMYGVIQDLTIDNCVFDGEDVSGRHGFSGGQLEGDVTITNSEFKNILGWALLDSRSGSGGDGSAMSTVTFAHNDIHDCNGSVVLRGLSTDRTNRVNAYENTWHNVGGNNGEQGQHWAALEVNRAVEVNVYDNTVDSVSLGEWGEGQAFQFWNIDTLNVYRNYITNNAQGIFIWGGAGAYAVPGGSIYNNHVANNTQYGLSLDSTATGGPLDASGNWWGTNTPAGVDAQVSANVDYTPWLDSGTDTSSAPGFQGNFSTLHVDDDSPQVGSTGRVQEGIHMVSGSTVYVAAGTYTERVTINQSVDLRGAQYGVDPTAVGARTDPVNESIITEAGLSTPNPDVLIEIPNGVEDVSINGFTLLGDKTNTTADTSVVRGWDDRITISHNIVDGMYGVIYKGGDTLTAHCNRTTINKAGVIVQPNPASHVTISDNVFNLGTQPVGDESAVYVTACTQCNVSGNTATGFTTGRALMGSNVNQLTVSGNTFTGNRDAVSIFGGSTNITIRDNDLSNSLHYGINIKGQDVEITGNEISNCGDVGINVARHVIDTEGVEIHYNNIAGNTNYGVKVDTAAVTEIVNATCNWWGASSGPTHSSNPAGAGDDVTGNVLFDPWLLGPAPEGPCGGSICVEKYHDLGKDGERDTLEPGLAGWEFTLYDADDNEVDSLTTPDSGSACFQNLASGAYKVCETLQEGWVNTDPGNTCQTAIIGNGSVTPGPGSATLTADGNSYLIEFLGTSPDGLTWNYRVTETAGKDLSHWILGLCMSKDAVVDWDPTKDDEGIENVELVYPDPTTQVSGIKWVN